MIAALRTVENTLGKLVSKNDKILVAFSGGSDSVFLLYAMKELSRKMGFSVSAAHLNHQIRPCADDEERFAERVCDEWEIEFFSKKADIPSAAREKGISSETAGREARYEFFNELREKYGFTKIATAHHMDDNAETILMHFIRGSGANGLKGIEYIRDDLIIRPLLDLSKQDIYNACGELELEYVTDMSNYEPVYTRNRVRLELIPEILKYNPNFARTVTANAELFAEDEEFINSYTKEIFCKNYKEGFPKSVSDELPAAVRRRVIQLIYADAAKTKQLLSKKYIDDVLNLKSGQSLSLPGGIRAYLSGGKYVMKIGTATGFEYNVEAGREKYIEQTGEIWKISAAGKEGKNTFYAGENEIFKIRSRRKGDRFYPVGMTGSKSVSDLFTDKKIPVYKRDSVPILTAGDIIVNIGGKFRDRRFLENNGNRILYKLEIK